MKYTDKLNLKKPEGTDTVDIDDFNDNADTLDVEVTKKASTTQDGRMSKEDKSKLDGIEQGANKYTHPANHPPSIITQDADNRFFTDAERTKLSGIQAGAQVNAVTSVAGKTGAVAVTKDDVGLGNVDNVKQASKTEHDNLQQEVDEHKAEIATETTLGHVMVDGETIFVSELGEVSTVNPNIDDHSDAPGNKILIAGDMQAGFFGEAAASELMNGSQLSSAVGLSSGTLQHSNEPYLKFAHQGNILFIAKKPIRHSLSWDQIDTANAVFGKIVAIGGLQYRVRLMRGALTDPSVYTDPDRGAKGSEWNKLMLPIHEEAIDKSWAYPAYVEDNVPIWVHSFGNGTNGMYTDADLLTHNTHGDGSYSWCQETRGDNTAFRVIRGYGGVSDSNSSTSSNTNALRGWRPVLELL